MADENGGGLNGTKREAALLLAGIAVAVQLPTTVAAIEQPLTRAIVQVAVVAVVFLLGHFTRRR